jgi:hypothetical protein
MTAVPGWWWPVLRAAHAVVTLAWIALVALFTDRSIVFGSGMLLLTGAAAGALWMMSKVTDAGRARDAVYVVLVLSAFALFFVALYGAQAVVAVLAPDKPGSHVARQLAGVMWTSEREIGVLAFILLALTALVHALTLIVSSHVVCSTDKEKNKAL